MWDHLTGALITNQWDVGEIRAGGCCRNAALQTNFRARFLLILRHAKTDKADTGRKDVDRPLTGRGKRDADAMGRYMQANGLIPDVVLCSPSRRARSTWDQVAAKIKSKPKVFFENKIYTSETGEDLLTFMREHGQGKAILLVGHNPSLAILARQLSRKGEKESRSRLENKFPRPPSRCCP